MTVFGDRTLLFSKRNNLNIKGDGISDLVWGWRWHIASVQTLKSKLANRFENMYSKV